MCTYFVKIRLHLVLISVMGPNDSKLMRRKQVEDIIISKESTGLPLATIWHDRGKISPDQIYQDSDLQHVLEDPSPVSASILTRMPRYGENRWERMIRFEGLLSLSRLMKPILPFLLCLNYFLRTRPDNLKYDHWTVEVRNIPTIRNQMLIPEDPLLFPLTELYTIQHPPSCELSVALSQLLAPLFLFAFSELSLVLSVYPTRHEYGHQVPERTSYESR